MLFIGGVPFVSHRVTSVFPRLFATVTLAHIRAKTVVLSFLSPAHEPILGGDRLAGACLKVDS